MHSHQIALLTICMVQSTIANVLVGPWASPAQERMDELHDAEIYKAVVDSMKAWESKHRQRTKREEPSICYPELGCFEASGPFGYLDMLPSKPEEIGTRFLLYPSHSRRRSGSTSSEFPFGNITDALTWAKTGLNTSLPLKVMIHGFGSDCSHIWVYEMRSALMAVDDLNVICVDWGNGATLPNYVKAAANTRLVGKQLAMLLRGMIESVGFSNRNVHLIGFSLGAHVAGFAGAELGNLSRITGLDPAGPLFESQDPRARLDQTDAAFVDVIHSNGENLILGGLGSWQPMGHVDFYPNGGRMQKGCSNIFVGAVSDIIWSSAVEGRSLCNHRRAYKFFTDSVSPRCHFPAFPCDSYDNFIAGKCFPCDDVRKCGNMGYYSDRSKGRGQLYLITRDEEPFCAHQYNIKIESSSSEVPIVSYGKIQITLIGDSLLNETFTLTRKEDEEMRLGSAVSRIIVPHPILLEPSKIQILYNAYSGWLTSGLLQWRIDKITLSDSFGRSSSVCKKNLLLESGVPTMLPLYPGECNHPNVDSSEAQIKNTAEHDSAEYEKSKNLSKFVPNPVVRLSSASLESSDEKEPSLTFRDAFEIFNIPWNNENNNIVDNEGEQSRAFNSHTIKVTRGANVTNGTDAQMNTEVVEPILKPHGTKGRATSESKNVENKGSEISEPILGPTTMRPITPGTPRGRGQKHNRELVYTFYDVEKLHEANNDWVPTVPRSQSQPSQSRQTYQNPQVKVPAIENKWQRQDDPNVVSTSTSRVYNYNGEREEQDAFNAIVRTVQFLPQRLARMFEEAEKYARETILPFVSTYTPKFISDFINVPNGRDPSTPKYLPLKFEESTEENAITTSRRFREHKEATGISRGDELNKHFNPPPTTLTGELPASPSTPTTTVHTYIQKISARKHARDALELLPEETTQMMLWEFEELDKSQEDLSNRTSAAPTKPSTPLSIPLSFPISRKSPHDQQSAISITSVTSTSTSSPVPLTSASDKKEVYINLPVIDEKYKEVKYIPLNVHNQSR